MLLRCLWVNFRQHCCEFSSLIQSYKHLEFCSEISLSSLKKPHFVDQAQCEYHYALVSQKCQFWASAGICFSFYLFLCFLKIFFFFLMWIIFKVFIEFATILLLFLYVLGFFCCFYYYYYYYFFGCKACRSLAPRLGIEPTSSALKGKVLASGPPGKSQRSVLYCSF